MEDDVREMPDGGKEEVEGEVVRRRRKRKR